MEESSNLTSDSTSSLPIFSARSKILSIVQNSQVCIITGTTGCGKSTQLSQFLLNDGYTNIVVSQPRRVGAVSVARRVAEEMNVRLGDKVGYTVRFEDNSSSKTEIRYMTDGCLLREVLSDRLLKKYNVVILDEAHERSLQTDILFGWIKDILPKRPDLKIIVTSATLESEKFSIFFNGCPTFEIPGNMFPVQVVWAHDDSTIRDMVRRAVATVVGIHYDEPNGDVLVFLPGQEEIETACRLLGKKIDEIELSAVDDEKAKRIIEKAPNIVVLPMYAALPANQQQKIFAKTPDNCRKVIIASNICETSITVDGIVYVVDPGFSKQKFFDEKTGIDSLSIKRISQVAAIQRHGRAGRTINGVCYRLYTENTFNEMDNTTIPEIRRVSLAHTVLLLKQLGVSDPLTFNFVDQPDDMAMFKALQQLWLLGALDNNGELKQLGSAMSKFPLDPPLSLMILKGVQLGVGDEVTIIVSLLAVENLFLPLSPAALASSANIDEKVAKSNIFQEYSEICDRQSDYISEYGDHITYLHFWKGWKRSSMSNRFAIELGIQPRGLKKALQIKDQLSSIVRTNFSSIHSSYPARKEIDILCAKSVASALYPSIARSTGVGYRRFVDSYDDRALIFIHPSSMISRFQEHPKWIVSSEIVFTSRPYMRHITAVDFEWIKDLIPRLTKIPQITEPQVEESECVKSEDNNDSKLHTSNNISYDAENDSKREEAKERYLQRKNKRQKRK